MNLQKLTTPHRVFPGGCTWHLTPQGISIDGAAPRGTKGRLLTIPGIWRQYGDSILSWCEYFDVPADLVLATIATESGGRESVGLMQVLIGTAQDTLANPRIDAKWLLDPDNAIQAGTAYIAQFQHVTDYDPPVVACAYNAGGVYLEDLPGNRWKMRQYPRGTGRHADRFVLWFNDCFKMWETKVEAPDNSLFAMLREPEEDGFEQRVLNRLDLLTVQINELEAARAQQMGRTIEILEEIQEML